MLSLFFTFLVAINTVLQAAVPEQPLARVNGTLLTKSEAELILDKRSLSMSDIEKVVLFQLAVQEGLKQNLDKDPATAAALKKVLYKAYLKNVSAKNADALEVSKEDLETEYRTFPLLRISQLVLHGTAEKNALKIKQIKEEYKKGIPFRKIVLKYSEDQTALHGGDLDFRSIHNFPENLYAEIRPLPKNVLSEPIGEGGNTFFFLWSDQRTFKDAPETYRTFLASRLSEQRELVLLRESLGELRKGAAVEILAGNASGGSK